jgi:hypothetical protein
MALPGDYADLWLQGTNPGGFTADNYKIVWNPEALQYLSQLTICVEVKQNFDKLGETFSLPSAFTYTWNGVEGTVPGIEVTIGPLFDIRFQLRVRGSISDGTQEITVRTILLAEASINEAGIIKPTVSYDIIWIPDSGSDRRLEEFSVSGTLLVGLNGPVADMPDASTIQAALRDTFREGAVFSDDQGESITIVEAFTFDLVTTPPPDVLGDPHFRRFWQEHRDSFMGECDLVFVSAPDFGGVGLDVHIRTTIRDDYSYVEAVAVKIGTWIVELDHRQFWLNGIPRDYEELPYVLDGVAQDYSLEREETVNSNRRTTIIRGPDGEDLVTIGSTKHFLSVKLHVNDADYGTSVGILGNYYTGDMVGRYGKVFDNFQDFGFEWQVNPEDPKLFVVERAPQLPYERCCLPSVQAAKRRRKLRAKDIDSELYKEADQACAHTVDWELCIDDVMRTGNLDLAESF